MTYPYFCYPCYNPRCPPCCTFCYVPCYLCCDPCCPTKCTSPCNPKQKKPLSKFTSTDVPSGSDNKNKDKKEKQKQGKKTPAKGKATSSKGGGKKSTVNKGIKPTKVKKVEKKVKEKKSEKANPKKKKDNSGTKKVAVVDTGGGEVKKDAANTKRDKRSKKSGNTAVGEPVNKNVVTAILSKTDELEPKRIADQNTGDGDNVGKDNVPPRKTICKCFAKPQMAPTTSCTCPHKNNPPAVLQPGARFSWTPAKCGTCGSVKFIPSVDTPLWLNGSNYNNNNNNPGREAGECGKGGRGDILSTHRNVCKCFAKPEWLPCASCACSHKRKPPETKPDPRYNRMSTKCGTCGSVKILPLASPPARPKQSSKSCFKGNLVIG